jgi:hypothetical protein
MAATGHIEPRADTAKRPAHPLLRLLAQGAMIEVLWGVGLLVVLAVVSVLISILLSAVGGG